VHEKKEALVKTRAGLEKFSLNKNLLQAKFWTRSR
jgi:hypothetical protein